MLFPLQIGVAQPLGTEVGIRVARQWFQRNTGDQDKVLLKVDFENAFNTLAVRNFPNREGLVDCGAAATEHDTLKDLDPLLAAFYNATMDLYRVSRAELGDIFLQLFLFNFINNIHRVKAVGRFGSNQSRLLAGERVETNTR